MLIQKHDSRISYWIGFFLTGIIPFFFAYPFFFGTFNFTSNQFDAYMFVMKCLFIYLGCITIIGHYLVYRKIYTHTKASQPKYKSFKNLFSDWILKNSIWHILGIVTIPMIILFLTGTLSEEYKGLGKILSPEAVGWGLLMIFSAFIIVIVTIFFMAVFMFFIITLPVTLISSLIFYTLNLTQDIHSHQT